MKQRLVITSEIVDDDDECRLLVRGLIQNPKDGTLKEIVIRQNGEDLFHLKGVYDILPPNFKRAD